MKNRPLALPLLLLTLILFQTSQPARAGSGTWVANPISGDWNTAANWSSNTVPGSSDTASFGTSAQINLIVTLPADTFQITFQPGADAYQITALPGGSLGVEDGGIINDSGVTQTFIAAADESGVSSQLGMGGGSPQGPVLFMTQARRVATGDGGVIWITYNANAGNATFINEGGVVSGGIGGVTNFYAGGIPHGAKAGTATILNQAATVSGASGGLTMLWTNSGAENATITCEGATVSGAAGGTTMFVDQTSAEDATLIAQGGSNGGTGGLIQFLDNTQGGTARIELFGDGTLDASGVTKGLTIGSLEGDGMVLLGQSNLNIGSNNLSTLFSGAIQGTGLVTKLGTGTLTLSGGNTYASETIVSAGVLVASNSSGSSTGTGAVHVNAGTVGGSGIISGAVTVGTGGGTGAVLGPAAGTNKEATLTIQSGLIFNSDSTYTFTFKARGRKARADQVIANGVAINGATFAFQGSAQGTLKTGLTLTAISNTAATPIGGAFANLPDGAILTANGNNFQASYEGGDGNDLTLTVVP